MKNTFGQSISVTVFGESHGAGVGVVIDGLAPGLPVEKDNIDFLLSRRRPSSPLDTARVEPDKFEILSGVFENHTTGTPLCIFIPNENTRSGDYHYGLARPSHTDYAAYIKYHGNEDYRGGGHFSGRITAALVAAGGILIPALNNIGIKIGTHILQCGGAFDRQINEDDIESLYKSDFPVLEKNAASKMSAAILKARENSDSIGGITQTAVFGVPAGVGEPWFDSVEGTISRAVFGIGGIKGIEFGKGFAVCQTYGSESNDAFELINGKVVTKTNNNGGINGGISNGMPIVFQCAVKPTPSIAQKQKTVDFIKKVNSDICIKGRHDPAIIRRICPVLDSITAIAICDMLALRYGTDVLKDGIS